MKINRMVLDLSHHETVQDYAKVKADGIYGIIYKATQGISYHDPTYWRERQRALVAGLLWGSYHFMEKGNVTEQVKNYLTYARPEIGELICLDFEDYGDNTPTLDQAKLFVMGVEGQLSRNNQCVVYSGNTLKEALGERIDPFWGARRLWLAQYGTEPVVQESWANFWLWQYTDGEKGPQPHHVAGITEGIDCNSFQGTPEQLRSEWATGAEEPAPPPPPPKELVVKLLITAPPGVRIEVTQL